MLLVFCTTSGVRYGLVSGESHELLHHLRARFNKLTLVVSISRNCFPIIPWAPVFTVRQLLGTGHGTRILTSSATRAQQHRKVDMEHEAAGAVGEHIYQEIIVITY
jgi:hypothetical protein